MDKDVGLRDVMKLEDDTERIRVTHQQQDNSLAISHVWVADSGLYTCMAKNAFGETRKIANLTVRKGTPSLCTCF